MSFIGDGIASEIANTTIKIAVVAFVLGEIAGGIIVYCFMK